MVSMESEPKPLPRALIQDGEVVANRLVCREHFRLTISVSAFSSAQPRQFVHLCPFASCAEDYVVTDDPWNVAQSRWLEQLREPMLRRAFSVARLVRSGKGVELDVVYRVVGTATRWLESLTPGSTLSVLGPLGTHFPIQSSKKKAWLVAGGVGLPPMLWLADALNAAGKSATAFCGAQSADLLALSLDANHPPRADATQATPSAMEFANARTGVVISTDDGSLGFHGHVGAALAAFCEANPTQPDEVVVYTCGPERMMRFVAELCAKRGIDCFACVERNMACGTGMCQSCVVPVRDEAAATGRRYRLCCTEGPVFDARHIIWDSH